MAVRAQLVIKVSFFKLGVNELCAVFEIRKVKPHIIVATPGRLIDLC
jgi:superfamily II DNA/RNA helicase